MVGKSVSVVAEWAHLGKTNADAGYRLLACSNGVLNGENFEELMLRYSPGTLSIATLPQITVSWLVGDKSPHYIALAVHYRSDDRRVDIGDREVMMTDYYCVPFEQLARGCVSYSTMYQELGRIQLPVDPPIPIDRMLPAASPGEAGSDFAKWVAALLLTSRPVCILGAENTAYTERLGFIDDVASLLPYGMRSRLSASTWTSSTYRDHKLRLFFSDADRNIGDQVAVWNQRGTMPPGYSYAELYLARLDSGALFPARLADVKEREALGLDFHTVVTTVNRLSKFQPPRRPPRPKNNVRDEQTSMPATVQMSQAVALRQPSAIESQLSATAEPERRIVELLEASLILLDGGDGQGLEKISDRLQEFRIKTPKGERPWLPELIASKGLLQEQVAARTIPEAQLRKFYTELIKLAFSPPEGHLDYGRFRAIEKCAGYAPGEPLTRPLAQAIEDAGPHGSVWLLLLKSLNDVELRKLLQDHPMSVADLVTMMVEPSEEPAHERVVCAQFRRLLRQAEMNGKPQRAAFVKAMRASNLIAVLHDRYAGDPACQYEVLRDVLRYAYVANLDRAAVINVFSSLRNSATPAPSDGLLAAMLPMVKSREVKAAVRDFAYFRLKAADIPDEVRMKLKSKLWQNVGRESEALHAHPRRNPWTSPKNRPVVLFLGILGLIAVVVATVLVAFFIGHF